MRAPVLEAIAKYMHPSAMVRDLWKHRSLIRQFTKREIEGRYKGSSLGMLWSLITPVMMLLVFTFMFGVVFKARWPRSDSGDQGLSEFAVVMFSGQMAFLLFSEPTGRAATLVTAVPNFVKKVVFPIQILPVAAVGAAIYHAGIGLTLAVLASRVVFGNVFWTALLTPLALAPIALLGLGMTWFLAALGVYLKDVGYLVAIALQLLFFGTPIFYPIASVPERYRALILANPLAWMVDLVRGCVVLGHAGSLETWAVCWATGLTFAVLGYAWFMVARRGFADVM